MAALVLWRSAYSRVRASSRSTLARCSPRFVAWREFTMDSHALAPLFVRVPLRAATMAVIMAAIDDGSMSRRKLHVSCWLCLLQQQASPCRCACLYGIVYLNCPPTPQTLTAATCTVVLDRKLRASSGACICETTLCVSCLVHTTVPYCPRRYQPVSLLESRLNLSLAHLNPLASHSSGVESAEARAPLRTSRTLPSANRMVAIIASLAATAMALRPLPAPSTLRAPLIQIQRTGRLVSQSGFYNYAGQAAAVGATSGSWRSGLWWWPGALATDSGLGRASGILRRQWPRFGHWTF